MNNLEKLKTVETLCKEVSDDLLSRTNQVISNGVLTRDDKDKLAALAILLTTTNNPFLFEDLEHLIADLEKRPA